jgi:TRAP-type C4-dicarboxylate transport system permease small subunit
VFFAVNLVLVTFFQVVNRFVLQWPIAWTEEAARYLSIWVILLGAARGVRENTHIQVDLLVTKLPGYVRAVLDTVTSLLIAAFLVVVIWQALEILDIIGRRRSPTLRISMYYVYIAGPISSALMLYYVSVRVVRIWRTLPERSESTTDTSTSKVDP